VKKCAEEFGIDCIQPEKIRREEVYNWIIDKDPEIIAVVAYGKILPVTILEIPEFGCINLHPSLLPKLRGAAPINWALMNGDEVTGISIIQMNREMDAGEIILQKEYEIYPDENFGHLSQRLAERGATILLEAVQRIELGVAQKRSQNEKEATYAPKITREMCEIDWTKLTSEICNFIRGLTPFPGAYSSSKGRRIKIVQCLRFQADPALLLRPGEVRSYGRGKVLLIGTGDGILEIVRLQPAGSKPMSSGEYIRGYKIAEGEVWGEVTV
jgi:methionyl-tRNA formyltransferase